MCNNYNDKGKAFRKLIITVFVTGLVAMLGSTLCCQGQRLWAFLAPLDFRANYTQEYIRQNKGKVIVEIPEVYELANIAIAISKYGLTDPRRVHKEGDYYHCVLKHFSPFKNHAIISDPVFDDNLGYYYAFRENSACYVFEGDSIIHGGTYNKMRNPNLFEKQRNLAEDFAGKGGFRKFYRDNLPYYQEQIQQYKDRVPVRKMWSWLERNFPARYDCYKVIFSPLIGGSHSTQRFEDKGFKEIVMFVSGPGASENTDFNNVAEGLLSRVVFTEIDHN